MYFVTTKREGYVLFALTPSERAALGLTDQKEIHLLRRQGADWIPIAKWNGNDYSHTNFMAAWHRRDEPADPLQLLEVLPADVRRS